MPWQYSTSFSAGSGLTLPLTHPIRAEDILRLVILHGNQQTLDYIRDVDFTLSPETNSNSIAWTDLPVVAGDTIVLFNYGSSALAASEPPALAAGCSGNQLERAAIQLATALRRVASCSVVYARGNQFVELKAAIGRTQSTVDPDPLPERLQSRDYLILAAELILEELATLPQVGDQIREINGLVYDVLPHGPEPCYRYADPYRRLLRIHTKHTGQF